MSHPIRRFGSGRARGRLRGLVASGALAVSLVAVVAPSVVVAAARSGATPTPPAHHQFAARPRIVAATTFTVSGAITGPTGTGVGSISVTLKGDGVEYPTTTTAAGAYSVGGVQAGYYSLRVVDGAGRYPTGYWSSSGFVAAYEASERSPLRPT